jgi:hypothetical protein
VISSKVDADHAPTPSLEDPELASLCGLTVVWLTS